MPRKIAAVSSVVWNGTPSLRPLLRPLSEMKADPENAATHDVKSYEAVAASLGRFGQQSPILVNGDGVVLCGNARLYAAEQLGWTHLAALVTDLTPTEARAYAIADNRTGEFRGWNHPRLAAAVMSLPNDLRDSLCFAPPELAKFEVPDVRVRPPQPAEARAARLRNADGDAEGDAGNATIICPHCGYRLKGQTV